MNLRISSTAESVIRSEVASGRFATPEEVVEQALQLLSQEETQAPAGASTVAEPDTTSSSPPLAEPWPGYLLQKQLLDAGIIDALRPPVEPALRRSRDPVPIAGDLLSETIIRERR